MRKLWSCLLAALLLTACSKDIINQPEITALKSSNMGTPRYPYGGFTPQDLKNRASIPSQADITVYGDGIVCGHTDIPSEIKSVIGESTNDCGMLCLSPKVNIWSCFSPREWVPSGATLISTPKWPYDMSTFCGYNHNAVAPTPPAATLSYPKNAGGGIVNTTLGMRCKAGEYDWSKLTATHCRVIVYNEGGTIFAESAIQPLNAAGGWIVFDSVPFSINTNTAYSAIYKSYIMLCQSDGNDLYYIPVEGSVTIEVVNVVSSVLSVSINNSIKVFSGGTTDNPYGDYLRITKTFNSAWGISADFLTLKSITFTIRNSSDGSFVSTATYTSFDSNDSQQTLDAYSNNDTETFQVSWVKAGRVYPGVGQYATVVMNY